MRNLLLLTLTGFILGMTVASAQDTTRPGTSTGGPRPGAQADTATKPVPRKFPLVFRKIERRKFDSTLFSNSNAPTTSDYLESLERVFLLVNTVPVTTSSFIHLPEIHEEFDEEDSALAILKDRIIATDDRTLNVRNLQMFNTLLDELDKSTDKYARYLDVYDKKMDNIKEKIEALKKDTLMLRIFRDTALVASFQPQLQELKGKWRQADSLIKLNAADINDLKARASANAITITDLTYQVDTQLKEVGSKAFGKERRYLWEPRTSGAGRRNFSREGFRKSVASEKKLVKYYFANTRSKRLWPLLTGVVFFFWILLNFRTLRRRGRLEAIKGFRFRYVNPRPFYATLVVILSLAPLFDLHAPAIYIETTQLLLMVLLTFLFRKRLPRNLFYGWCIFILLFFLLPVTRILGLPVSMQRWANLVQDGLSVAFGLVFLFGARLSGLTKLSGFFATGRAGKAAGIMMSTAVGTGTTDTGKSTGTGMADIKKTATTPGAATAPGQSRMIIYSAGLYVFFNLLAVCCNLAGRVTLSQIFGATAIYAFAQTVSLAIFSQSVVEAFLLQIQTSRVRKNYPEQFDTASVEKSIRRAVTALSVILWLIVFTTNLNIFDALNYLVTGILTEPRQVGSFSFTLGGIVLFMGIIWIANFLQRYITFFFGDTGDDAAIDDRGQRSKLLVTRLILLIAGFLLAVAASGLPIDKITVILGALGVGIGLGLQSIVNNFVSGIILIFDRPLRIGDTVEIGDKKGRVKEIGIRSSTLLTDEGAEVIIPNGDVLSHNIVNWTLSNNHVRVSLSFTIGKPARPEDIQADTIKKIIRSNPNVLERREPEVILNSLSSKSIEIKVFFWSKDFGKTSLTTGDIRTAIYDHLDKQGITVL